MIMNYIANHLRRNWITTSLISLIIIISVVAIGVYLTIISSYEQKIDFIYDHTVVNVQLMDRKNGIYNRKIPMELADKVISSDLIENIYLEMQPKIYTMMTKTNIMYTLDGKESIGSPIYCTNDLARAEPIQQGMLHITFLEGYGYESFDTKEKICILPSELMEDNQIKLGDEIKLSGYRDHQFSSDIQAPEFKIIGSYSFKNVETNNLNKLVFIPIEAMKVNMDEFVGRGMSNTIEDLRNIQNYSYVSFKLKDSRQVHAFREMVYTIRGLTMEDMVSEDEKIYVYIEDQDLLTVVTPLENILNQLVRVKPFFILSIYSIGIILVLISVHIRRKEIAVLRLIGSSTYHIVATIVCEMSLLYSTSIVAGGVILLGIGKGFEYLDLSFIYYVIGYFVSIEVILGIYSYWIARKKVLRQLNSEE